MSGFLNILGDWHLWVLALVYVTISNMISALPMPDATSSPFYGWAFKVLNGILGSNIIRALAGKIPGTQDVMPLPGAQEAIAKAAVVAKAAEIVNP
jgi:hypothetical protein